VGFEPTTSGSKDLYSEPAVDPCIDETGKYLNEEMPRQLPCGSHFQGDVVLTGS